jgi:anti-sigma B factor antagonist
VPVLSDPFQLNVHPLRDVVVVAPQGELDLVTADPLEAQLRDLHESGFARLVVDLRGLSFLDSSGIRLLVKWTREAQRNGHEFAVIRGGAAVERVLELTRVEDLLTYVEPRSIEG